MPTGPPLPTSPFGALPFHDTCPGRLLSPEVEAPGKKPLKLEAWVCLCVSSVVPCVTITGLPDNSSLCLRCRLLAIQTGRAGALAAPLTWTEACSLALGVSSRRGVEGKRKPFSDIRHYFRFSAAKGPLAQRNSLKKARQGAGQGLRLGTPEGGPEVSLGEDTINLVLQGRTADSEWQLPASG